MTVKSSFSPVTFVEMNTYRKSFVDGIFPELHSHFTNFYITNHVPHLIKNSLLISLVLKDVAFTHQFLKLLNLSNFNIERSNCESNGS